MAVEAGQPVVGQDEVVGAVGERLQEVVPCFDDVQAHIQALAAEQLAHQRGVLGRVLQAQESQTLNVGR